MFKSTVDNLYHIVKDMTVKPSIYKNCIYTERAFRMGFCYRTILNTQKDFVITHHNSNELIIDLTEYKYSVWVPFDLKHTKYRVKKYASKNNNEFIPIHSVSAY